MNRKAKAMLPGPRTLLSATFVFIAAEVAAELDNREKCSFSAMKETFTDPVYHKASRVNSCWEIQQGSDIDFQKLLQTRRPVLLRGGAWPNWRTDVQRWRRESLLQELGTKKINVRITETEDLDVGFRGIGGIEMWKNMSLRAFFEDKSNRHLYWDNQGISDLDESLVVTPKFSEVLQHNMKYHRQWVARSNTSAAMHYDPDPNLMLVIEGSKTFYMADMLQSHNIYINPDMLQYAQGNPFHPDVSQHPLLLNASFDVCRLEAGDVIYVPSFWWHFVRSEPSKGDGGNSIAVNWFFEEIEDGPSNPQWVMDQGGCSFNEMLQAWAFPVGDDCMGQNTVLFKSTLPVDADIVYVNDAGERHILEKLRSGEQQGFETWPSARFEIIQQVGLNPRIASFVVPCHDQVFVVNAQSFINEDFLI